MLDSFDKGWFVLQTYSGYENKVKETLLQRAQTYNMLDNILRVEIPTQNVNVEKNGKIKEVEERDRVRNFQPPVSGEEIMKTFDLQPCKEVGLIKSAIKEAILEGEIENNYESARKYMIEYGKNLYLNPKLKESDL